MPTTNNPSSTDYPAVQKKLDSIKQNFRKYADLSMTLPRVHAFLNEHHFPDLRTTLEGLEDDYQLMSDFMLKGYKDDKRGELYQQLLCRLYHLLGDLDVDFQTTYNPLFSPFQATIKRVVLDEQSILEKLESFVQDVAMLSLEPEEQRKEKQEKIYGDHFNYINKLFLALVFSRQWSKSFGQTMAKMVVSPTIDNIDAQTIVAAIMLSAMNVGDPEKVLSLVSIYRNAQDEGVRQRALVGWVFAIDHDELPLFPEVGEEIGLLMDDEKVRHELLQLQMQVVYCQNVTRDNERIQKDIMPTIMKNQDFEVTRYGIREKDEDPLQDILHPDADDQKMEEMEKAINKMVDMQKAGADLYFGGFSQMKRFSFFYTLCNWFTPFYVEHPQLRQIPDNFKHSPFMQQLMANGPFCDSDKYSFVLGFSTVYDRLPEKIKEMLSADNMQIGVPELRDNMHQPAYIRRMYLQDLYRFFRLNDYRKAMQDPFDDKGERLFLTGHIFSGKMRGEAHSLKSFLLKQQMYDALWNVLEVYADKDRVEDLRMKAVVLNHRGDTAGAADAFRGILDILPDDERALKGLALACFYLKDYAGAEQQYQRLCTLHPDNRHYLLYRAIVLINLDRAEEGVKILFRLSYEHPDDANTKRALAWGELWLRHTDQSERLYQEILQGKDLVAADYLNAGYCSWFEGRIQESVDRMKRFVVLSNRKVEGKKMVGIHVQFEEDRSLLDRYDVPLTDRKIMADLVSRNANK